MNEFGGRPPEDRSARHTAARDTATKALKDLMMQTEVAISGVLSQNPSPSLRDAALNYAAVSQEFGQRRTEADFLEAMARVLTSRPDLQTAIWNAYEGIVDSETSTEKTNAVDPLALDLAPGTPGKEFRARYDETVTRTRALAKEIDSNDLEKVLSPEAAVAVHAHITDIARHTETKTDAFWAKAIQEHPSFGANPSAAVEIWDQKDALRKDTT